MSCSEAETSRYSYEQVLLLQAELLPVWGIVLGVEDLGDVLCAQLVLAGAQVVAVEEVVEVELACRPGGEQAECVHRVVAVTGHRHVVGQRQDVVRIDPLVATVTILVDVGFDPSIELHSEGVLRTGDLPGIAESKPIVRFFDLITIADALMEHSVVVADAVAVSRQLERGHGIEKAGRQTSQSAVAQSRFLFQIPDLLHVVTELEQRLLALLEELEVDQAVAKRASDQEFERQVVDSFEVRILVVGPPCRDPAFDEPIAHHPRQRDVQVSLGRMARDLGLGEGHVVQEGALERVHVQAEPLAACREPGRDRFRQAHAGASVRLGIANTCGVDRRHWGSS
jgi:hypothetical protein